MDSLYMRRNLSLTAVYVRLWRCVEGHERGYLSEM